MNQGSYFDVSPDAKPLMHYWSLAVEDQFYLLFPFYLYFVLRFSARPLLTTLLIAALSFAACLTMGMVDQAYAFYLLPARAWQLLAGTCLAMIMQYPQRENEKIANLSALVGLFIILLSVCLFSGEAGYPNFLALIPIAGTLLVLRQASREEVIVSRMLSFPAFVFVGKISYSLYLWHWPIFSFVDYNLFETSASLRVILKISLSISASVVTYYFVERPGRVYLNDFSLRKITFAGAAGLIAITSWVSYTVRNTYYLDAKPADIPNGGIIVNENKDTVVVLAGDSEASIYGKDLASLAKRLHFTLHVISASGRNILPNTSNTLWPQVSSFIAKERPDVLVLACLWSGKIANDSEPLRAALTELRGRVGRFILLAEAPTLPAEASREGIRLGFTGPFFEPARAEKYRRAATTNLQRFANDQVIVLDVSKLFLGPATNVQYLDAHGYPNFRDELHLSSFGIAKVRPWLENALFAALATPKAKSNSGS